MSWGIRWSIFLVLFPTFKILFLCVQYIRQVKILSFDSNAWEVCIMFLVLPAKNCWIPILRFGEKYYIV